MRADYDSEADALLIDLIDIDRCDERESLHDANCDVALKDGQPANVELRFPRRHLDLLDRAAERFGIDGEAMRAAAKAALAAPDRPITIEVAGRVEY